jgi:hypothetical protein
MHNYRVIFALLVNVLVLFVVHITTNIINMWGLFLLLDIKIFTKRIKTQHKSVFGAILNCIPVLQTLSQGILKGKYHCTVDLLCDLFGLFSFAN